ncbi:hypothetical protein [Cupriavidus metallidurans]|uniref:hypothetical protein n=1 Tax=Cupriavidus metallidurans TaxID=119219 RepID=UPI00056604B4|nr:hypothetical protein [Cupriavidus metallidurans]
MYLEDVGTDGRAAPILILILILILLQEFEQRLEIALKSPSPKPSSLRRSMRCGSVIAGVIKTR